MRKTLAWITFAGVALCLYLGVRASAIPSSALASHGGSIEFLDRSGIPLGTILSPDQAHEVSVPLERVSPFFVRAIVATEDSRFYHHGAVDAFALARAAAQAVQCGCIESGASTISMQLARMKFDIQSSLRGKLLQILYAWRIENGSSKDAILAAYVNRVAMGGNVYGIEAAARTYFGIPASDLDLAQASLLAGIPNDPVGLDPRAHWADVRRRQSYVLARMVATRGIAQRQADVARREQLHLVSDASSLRAAQHLLFRLARERADATSPVRTTIDLPLQRFVEQQAREVVAALDGHDVTQAAALVIDNTNGDVLAYVGSLDYFDDAYLGRNDGVHALRQPGSTLKPFLYDYALERRVVRPQTVLADVPASYAIPNGRLYSPQDYDRRFAGPVLVRLALANSLNVPAVRVLSRVGVPAFLDRLHKLGFTDLQRSPGYYGLGLTLGAGEVSLWNLAHAYVTMARNGSAVPLRTMADDPPAHPAQIGDAATWELVTDMLADRYARAAAFGVGSVIDMPFPAAVKTGTSSGLHDTWAVGFTREYTVAVWAGNFTGAPMRAIAGVSGAGPLWNRIMLHLYERREPPPFDPPDGYRRVRLCSRTGSRNLRGCREVVSEYLDRGDLEAPVRDSQQTLAGVDEWRAAQGETRGPLRVLFPHDGDVFEDNLGPHDPRRAQQRIAFIAAHPAGTRLRWEINGTTLGPDTADRADWTARRGTWTLSVTDGHEVARVKFTVVRARTRQMRGFIVR
ncbi:MAG: penicillin-binding protein 1C [Vulcanimicrobiaceae bacterium]